MAVQVSAMGIIGNNNPLPIHEFNSRMDAADIPRLADGTTYTAYHQRRVEGLKSSTALSIGMLATAIIMLVGGVLAYQLIGTELVQTISISVGGGSLPLLVAGAIGGILFPVKLRMLNGEELNINDVDIQLYQARQRLSDSVSSRIDLLRPLEQY